MAPLQTDWYSAPVEAFLPIVDSTVRQTSFPAPPPAGATVFVLIRAATVRNWVVSGMGATWNQVARQNTGTFGEYALWRGYNTDGTGSAISISTTVTNDEPTRVWMQWFRFLGPTQVNVNAASQSTAALVQESYATLTTTGLQRRLHLIVFDNNTTNVAPIPTFESTTPSDQREWFLSVPQDRANFFPEVAFGLFTPRVGHEGIVKMSARIPSVGGGNVYSLASAAFEGTMAAEPVGAWEFTGSSSDLRINPQPPSGHEESLTFDTSASLTLAPGFYETMSFEGTSDVGIGDFKTAVHEFFEFSASSSFTLALSRHRRPNSPYRAVSVFDPAPELKEFR